MLTLGFLVALQIAAHRYDVPGPITSQWREVVLAPKSGFLLYASMGLMMVVLTWRQRLYALGAAVGIDAVFLLVRWAAGAGPTFGNGALWVILGVAGLALTRRTGNERALLLKGVGLGLLLVTGRKVGDTWLLITSKARPTVLDQYAATADRALGDPSWVAGRVLHATGPVGTHLLDYVYIQLAVAAVAVAVYQLRHVATERRFPRHHLVRTFLVIGMIGPAVYMLFPTVGPVFAYGPDGGHWAVADMWPHTMPAVTAPHAMDFDQVTPRNCMPSLHTAWATAIFVHSRKGPRALRYAGAFWLVATLAATLGFGYHYGVDLIAGAVFSLTIEGALRAYDRGWDASGVQLVAYGTAVFAALLAAYRWLPLEMAEHPWTSGPLLTFALVSVIALYVRTTQLWEPDTAPAPQPEPQPALA
ncbi:inositol phosphorylceramide synthase [Streptomyces sp. PRB2-1]|uniref:Inositol phosphorylceramide synthase n=1 Tax=Actinacidiphila epipremni TaxID=2053013 RepID=A0ABX0ZSZ5_9ACTN|nr:inositol phosphorylceramide synthase [Actinacidiphila epipremni]